MPRKELERWVSLWHPHSSPSFPPSGPSSGLPPISAQGLVEDSLEKGMTAHSSVLAWRILWAEDPGEPYSMVSQSQTRLRE